MIRLADGVTVVDLAPPTPTVVATLPGPPGPGASPWDEAVTYGSGRPVLHGGAVWWALVESVGVEPGTDPDVWLAGGSGGGGGGGAVDSVNGKTGDVVLGAADVDAATAAQGAKADTAVQPDDLAPVATSGDYSDLAGRPTIPSTPAEVGASPEVHAHAQADVAGLAAALASKVDTDDPRLTPAVSADAGNAALLGSDDLIYVPEPVAPPSALGDLTDVDTTGIAPGEILRYTGSGYTRSRIIEYTTVDRLTEDTCDVWTGDVTYTGGGARVTTLAGGRAARTILDPIGWYASFSVAALPPPGEVLTLEGGTRYLNQAYPCIAITAAGAAILTNPGGTIYHTFPTTGVGEKFVFSGEPGKILLGHLTASEVVRDSVLFPGSFTQASYLRDLGVICGARGHGAVSQVILEDW